MQRNTFSTKFEEQLRTTDYSRENFENENAFSEYACMGGRIHTFSDCAALSRLESENHKRIDVKNPVFDDFENLV